jgi:hypothetical protein
MVRLKKMRENQVQKNGIRQLLQYVYSDKPMDLEMVEIGVYRGESTTIFLNSRRFKKIYAIDPWCMNGNGDRIYSDEEMNMAEIEFDSLFYSNDIVIKKKGRIEDVYKEIPKVNLVYIDSLHDRETTIEHIKIGLTLFDRSKESYICGHDYCMRFPGVINAVNWMLEIPDRVFCDTSWLITLKKENLIK